MKKGTMKKGFILTLLISLLTHANTNERKQTMEKDLSQTTKQRITRFVNRMKNWGYYYGDLAGNENLRLAYDDQVKSENLLIEGGDWAVFDRRLCSGAYGISHEDGSIYHIELKEPEKHDTHCFSPPITSSVDAIILMKRYQWFHALFIDWAHVLTPSPLGVSNWNSTEAIDKDYEKEKTII